MDFLKFAGKIASATLAGVAEADAKRAAKNVINDAIDRVNDECGTDIEHVLTSGPQASYEAQKRREAEYARRSGKNLRQGTSSAGHCYVPQFIAHPVVTRQSSHSYYCENPATRRDCEVEATYDINVHFARCSTGAGEYDVTYSYTPDIIKEDIEIDYYPNQPFIGILCNDECNEAAVRFERTRENFHRIGSRSFYVGKTSDGRYRVVTEDSKRTYVYYQIQRGYASSHYWVEVSYPNSMRGDMEIEPKLVETGRKLAISYRESIQEM